jgi:hypothetical protein
MPIADARVKLNGICELEKVSKTISFEIISNKDGSFEFSNIPIQEGFGKIWNVEAEADGFYSNSTNDPINITSDKYTLIYLKKIGIDSGIVLNSDNEPLPKAVITMYSYDDFYPSDPIIKLKCDNEGCFRISGSINLNKKPATIVVEHPSAGRAIFYRLDNILKYPDSYFITGSVYYQDGNPCVNARILIQEEPPVLSKVSTNSEGYFEINSLHSKPWRIIALDTNYNLGLVTDNNSWKLRGLSYSISRDDSKIKQKHFHYNITLDNNPGKFNCQLININCINSINMVNIDIPFIIYDKIILDDKSFNMDNIIPGLWEIIINNNAIAKINIKAGQNLAVKLDCAFYKIFLKDNYTKMPIKLAKLTDINNKYHYYSDNNGIVRLPFGLLDEIRLNIDHPAYESMKVSVNKAKLDDINIYLNPYVSVTGTLIYDDKSIKDDELYLGYKKQEANGKWSQIYWIGEIYPNSQFTFNNFSVGLCKLIIYKNNNVIFNKDIIFNIGNNDIGNININ